MAKLNMVEAINLALREEMERDNRILVLGEDVGKEGGVFRVTDGLQVKFGKDRVVDTPLAETGIVGTAFGMAVYGLRPIAEIQFEGFLFPCLDQINNHISRIRNRSRGRFTCPLVIRVPYGGGIHAPEHHSDSPEAILAHIPGIKVVIPSTPYEAKGLLLSSIRDPDPVIFFEPKRIYRAIREEVPEGDYAIPLGKARLVQEGRDVTVVSWGAMVREALNAAEQLKAAEELTQLAEKARNRTIDLADLKGGTFTITNYGALGGIYGTPIINHPEVAILGVGKIKDMPVVEDGKIEIRKILHLALSFDHRVVDGGEATRFLNTVIARLEDPDLILLET